MTPAAVNFPKMSGWRLYVRRTLRARRLTSADSHAPKEKRPAHISAYPAADLGDMRTSALIPLSIGIQS